MKFCFGSTSARRAHVSPLSLLVLLLASSAAYAVPPVASNVSISGTPVNVGVQLSGSYSYSDGDFNPESGTTFQWYRGGLPIGGATGENYTLAVADIGAQIIFEVTPRDGTADSPGVAVPSTAVGPVGANEAPVAGSVSISGTNTLGSTLNGSYSYSDAEGDAQGTPTLQWLRNGAAIPLANSSSYTVQVADVETNLRFAVTPAALSGTSPGSQAQSADFAIANSPPVLAAIGPQSVVAAATVNIALTASDPDGDTLNFSFSGVPGQANSFCSIRNISNGVAWLDCTPGVSQSGNYSITVTVADDGASSLDDEETFTLTVGANEPPVASSVTISGSNTFGSLLGGSYTYSDAETDDEGTSTFQWLRNGANIPSATGTTYTVQAADVETNLRFQVTPVAQTGASPGLAAQSADFTIPNSVPDLTPIGPQSVLEDATVNIALSATDPDGDALTLSFLSTPAQAQAFCSLTDNGNGSGSLGCAPPVGDAGAYSITVTARDDGLTPLQDSEVFTLTVGANEAPTVSGVTITGVPALSELLTGTYTYADTEGDVEGISTFRWLRDGIAIPGAIGSTYTVAAADIETSLSFEVTPVAQTGATPGTPVVSPDLLIDNSAPSITGQVALETPEETPLTILVTNLTVTDADSTFPDDFTLTVLDSPDLIPSYTRSGPNGHTITPALDLNGPITVPVTVNDGFEDSAVFNLLVTVTPLNDLPAFVGVVPPGLTTPEDTTLTIVLANLVITDPDNINPDELTLTLATPGPADNYTLAGATAITPALNFNGLLNVVATVSDLEGASAPFVIPVDVDPVNDLPVVVAPIGPQQAVEASPFVLDITPNFSDDDVTDTLTYTAEWLPSKPPNIDLNAISGIFSGTPQLVDAETPGPIYTVVVTAADLEGEIVSDTFDLTINALGRANLNMTIDVAPATALPSEELRWTFTINNPVGPVAGENVQLTGSVIGSGITVTAQGAVNCTLNVQSAANRTDFTCDVGNVPVGSNPQIAFTTTTSVATEIVTFGTVAGVQEVPIDPNEDDNSDLVAAGVADSFSTLPVQDLGTSSIRSVAAGDVNGDGAPDIVVGTISGQPVQIFFNDVPREACNCQRDFLGAPISIPDTGPNEGVALADFDGNGTLDLVVVNGGDQDDVVYVNDGNGNFALSQTLGPSNANDVAVGDFNNDGNIDIAIAASSPNLVYFGAGNGTFSVATPLGDADSQSVAVGRFDGNNLTDLAFANFGADSTVYTKNGGAGFTLRDQLLIGDAASVAASDLNGDGIDDLVFGRVASNVGDIPSNPVLINTGNGTFGVPLTLLGLSPTNEVLIGDVNADGAPDLVFISTSGVHQVWLDTGGNYTLHSEQILDLDSGSGVLTNLGDADDGDSGGVDLAMGGRGNAGVGVWLNDSAGNLGLGDAVIPVLTLTGEASVSVPAKSNYIDAGATALDNIDGNISPSIIVSNSVNTSIVGSYIVTYNVQDRAGNPAAQISRSVNVTPASGGGGGGGGAVSYWLLAFLLAMNIAGVIRMRRRAVSIKGRKD